MKSHVKKALIALCLSLVVFTALPTIAYAENCLDVRNYGYHRYNHRSYDTLASSVSKPVRSYTYNLCDPNGKPMIAVTTTYRVTDTYKRTWICVCGAERSNKDTFTSEYETTKTHYTYK